MHLLFSCIKIFYSGLIKTILPASPTKSFVRLLSALFLFSTGIDKAYLQNYN